MVPLFQLWFGLTFQGAMLFVAYGVGVIFFTGTVNAVRNIPPIYFDNARTLGANRLQLYRTVILPAMFLFLLLQKRFIAGMTAGGVRA